MIRSGQFLNLLEISSMSTYLQASGTVEQNWRSNTDDKVNQRLFSNQGDVTLRLMIRSGQFSILSEISFMSTLSASFRKIWSKLNDLCWWQSNRGFFSNRKDVTLRVMIQSGQFWNLSEISSISFYLQVSRISNQNWMSNADDKVRSFFSNQGDVTL